ncbi:MAG: YheU family protein [Pirellulaceae bacterium]|nr:YheU family protein [Pirellulaceae bacterium]
MVVDRIGRGMLYTAFMRIPHTQLSAVALRAVVDEFVTRDGTDHSSVDERIETVLRQLDAGRVELHFDVQAQTCHIVPVKGNSPERGTE